MIRRANYYEFEKVQEKTNSIIIVFVLKTTDPLNLKSPETPFFNHTYFVINSQTIPDIPRR